MKPFPKAAIEKARVLVVGDVMLDRYWFGEVERISPEAPVQNLDDIILNYDKPDLIIEKLVI